MMPFGLSAKSLKKSTLSTISDDKLSLFFAGAQEKKSQLQKVRPGPMLPAAGSMHGLASDGRRGGRFGRAGAWSGGPVVSLTGSDPFPRPQAKEEKDSRRKQEEDEAARVYEQFVSSFDGGAGEQRTFVRGGVRARPHCRLQSCFALTAPLRR